LLFFFFFNDTATTEIYTLSLHDALPISGEWLDIGGPSLPEPERFLSMHHHIHGAVRDCNHARA